MSYSIVTGAAKGIGKGIALELAKRNYSLVLIDMDELGLYKAAQEIKKHYNVFVETFTIDLSDEDAADKVFHLTKRYHDQLTVVVNNAGYGLNGSFADIPYHQHIDNINVNIKAVVGISHCFIPVLNKQAKGYLLNVASTTAYQTVPYLNIYASTKAFVLSFTRGLRYELRDANVSVSALSPGSTDTDFVKRAQMGAFVLKTAEKFNMTAEAVGKIAVEGMFKGKTEIVPGFTNKLNAFLPKFFPKTFVEKIAGRIYEPKQQEVRASIFSKTSLRIDFLPKNQKLVHHS
jgi:uncharacterized protein